MEYRRLPHGTENERFSALGIGLGGIQKVSEEEIEQVVRCAIDHGINFFDLCAGGCADIAMVENGLENMPTEYCYVFKTVYSHVKEFYEGVMRDNTPLSELNPTVKNVFARGLSKMSMTAQNPLGDSYV